MCYRSSAIRLCPIESQPLTVRRMSGGVDCAARGSLCAQPRWPRTDNSRACWKNGESSTFLSLRDEPFRGARVTTSDPVIVPASRDVPAPGVAGGYESEATTTRPSAIARMIRDAMPRDEMNVVGLILFFIGFVALGLASTVIEPAAVQKLSFAAPAGLACGVAAVLPRRWWFAYGAAVFGATILLRSVLGLPFGQSVASGFAGACEAWAFAWLVSRVWPGVRDLGNRVDVAHFFSAAAISAAFGASLTVVMVLPFSTAATGPDVWAVRFTGHFLGIVVIAPVFLLRKQMRRVSLTGWAELGLCALALLAISEVSFDPSITTVVFPYVPLGVMLVMVVRLQTPGAVLLPFTVVPVALWQTSLGHGPFAQLTRSPFQHAIAAQLYGLTAGVCAWLIAAVLGERAAAMDALRNANETLEERVAERTARLATATRMAEAGARVSETLAEAGLDHGDTVNEIADRLADVFDGVVRHRTRVRRRSNIRSRTASARTLRRWRPRHGGRCHRSGSTGRARG